MVEKGKKTKSYLKRIHYSGSISKDLNTLRKLHVAHLRTVPFENLDIHLGRRILLSESAFYRKIVENGRGGFCYELNGSFANLLRALGFDVTLLSAKVAKPEGGYTAEFDHMTLLVRTGSVRWLADVGFGDSFVKPKRLDSEEAQEDASGKRYKITKAVSSRILWQSDKKQNSWKQQYKFTMIARRLEDFGPRCVYQQTSPRSYFRKGKICTRLTRSGKITLTGEKLILTKGDYRKERPVGSASDFQKLLKKYFGIAL